MVIIIYDNANGKQWHFQGSDTCESMLPAPDKQIDDTLFSHYLIIELWKWSLNLDTGPIIEYILLLENSQQFSQFVLPYEHYDYGAFYHSYMPIIIDNFSW